jgi:hypothetical protein
VQAPILALDNPVGAATLTSLNDDQFVDLVLYDWVKCELHMLYGVGKGRFIDQSTFPVQGEVDQILALPFFRDHGTDLILISHKTFGLQLWQGNEVGDYRFKTKISPQRHFLDVSVGEVGQDGFRDLLLTVKPSAVQILHNSEEHTFNERDEVAAGEEANSLQWMHSIAGTRAFLVTDHAGGQVILYTLDTDTSSFQNTTLAAGVYPTVLAAHDWNGDGICDIVVANSGSKSLAFYWGRDHAAPAGPEFYNLSHNPTSVLMQASVDSIASLVVSYAHEKQLSSIQYDERNHTSWNASVSCEGHPVLLTASRVHGALEFTNLNTAGDEGTSLSFYDRLSQTSFLERTFRLNAPDRLLGAVVNETNHDSIPDIVFAYRHGDTAQVEFALAYGDAGALYQKRIIIGDALLPEVQTVYLWWEKNVVDSSACILVYAGFPKNVLAVMKEKESGAFDSLEVIGKGILLDDRSSLQVADINHDGIPDILTSSAGSGDIIWFPGLGHSKFGKGTVLLHEPHMSHFAVGDFNGDGWNDLAVSLWKQGAIRIIDGRTLPLHEGK